MRTSITSTTSTTSTTPGTIGAATNAPRTAASPLPLSRRVCFGCGASSEALALEPRCPHAGDGGDHVFLRELDVAHLPFDVHGDLSYPSRPFLRWRHRLHAWHLAQARGFSDADFIALVDRLEERLGAGFRLTPLHRADEVSALLSREAPVFIKDETHNVGGSHKARHLFPILLALEILGVERERPLVIASCGNAALAAAILAQAAERPLTVHVPPDAPAPVLASLSELHARVVVCERRPGEVGDPTVHAMHRDLARGAIPFTVQGSENGLALEGGELLGLEVASALTHWGPHARIDTVFVQVGGGALGAGLFRGLAQAYAEHLLPRLPRLFAVQTQSVSPLARAYHRLTHHLAEQLLPCIESDEELRAESLRRLSGTPAFARALRDAARHRGDFMSAWESFASPSVAHGILDDETYDWLALCHGMLITGGRPIVVSEAEVVAAHALGVNATDIPVCETGTAGLAGLMHRALRRELPAREGALVVFSGRAT